MNDQNIAVLVGTALLLSLSACGGGGGGGVQSIPPPQIPPPPPPPPPTATVTIFANPIVETYATVGVARSTSASDGVLSVFGILSKADTDQPHIRYNAAGFYEIQMPGDQWTSLIHSGNVANPTSDDYYLAPSLGSALLTIERARLTGYKYSELALWTLGISKGGEIAFGSSTQAGSVPITGSANYLGIVRGTSDIRQEGPFGPILVPVNGDVNLAFNFGAGTLAGAMTLSTNPQGNPVGLGSFAFKDTVFGVGSTNYSGAFATPASGANYFFGQFTGPAGQEVIGAWALPFIYSGDGQTHETTGAWIAK